MSDSIGDIIERVIKTILSCQTQEQLDVAFTYSRLAKKYYHHVIRNRNCADQFGLDMLVLVYVKLLELRRDEQNSADN